GGTPSVANYFFYLLRNEVIPDQLRKTLNLNPGQGTYYNIVGGVGVNGDWSYSPFMVCRGTYNVTTETTFSFEALKSSDTGLSEDLPTGWECTFDSPTTGYFNIDMKWPDPQSKSGGQLGFTAVLQSVRAPFYVNPGGCMPCSGGAGTLYFSFTQMVTEATLLTSGQTSTSFSNGTGWIDRQWLNNYISNKSLKALSNVVGTFSIVKKGLGRYLWYNLHLSPSLQYMVNVYPTKDLKAGDTLSTLINKYADNTTWNINGTVTVEETVDVQDPNTGATIKYPTILTFHIPNKKSSTGEDIYCLDTTPFGVNVTVDLSNNIHWTGSAILYDSQNRMVGTGFAEANQLQDNNTYTSNILAKSKIDQSNSQLFTSKPLSFTQ